MPAVHGNIPNTQSEGLPAMAVVNGFTSPNNSNPYRFVACDGNGRLNLGSGSAAIKILDSNGVGTTVDYPADGLTPDNYPLAVTNFAELFNGSTWDRFPGNTLGAFVQGNVASAATDSGNPVKVGAKYNATEPTFSDTQRGDLQIGPAGHLKTAVRRNVTTLSNISTTYNNVTTTATSGAVDARMYRYAKFYWSITKVNTPTDITVVCQISPDNTNWFDYRRYWWVKYRFSTAAVGGGVNDCMDIDLLGSYVRFVVTATGTTASNTFTVSNATLEIFD